MTFTLINSDKETKARAGIIETDHGSIETPIFMPVGTAATVKAVHFKELEDEIEDLPLESEDEIELIESEEEQPEQDENMEDEE